MNPSEWKQQLDHLLSITNKMFIVWHDDHNYGTETRDQEPKDDLDSPSGSHEDGKFGLDSMCAV